MAYAISRRHSLLLGASTGLARHFPVGHFLPLNPDHPKTSAMRIFSNSR